MTISIKNKIKEKRKQKPPTVKIKLEPCSVIYEGDVIDCNVTGNPSVMYWRINECAFHETFHKNNPVIFDPEPTPSDDMYVILKVCVENNKGKASDSVKVKIKRLFFGDIHWHTKYCDGTVDMDEVYNNAISDNYLDFAASSVHASTNYLYYFSNLRKKLPLLSFIVYKINKDDPWEKIKKEVSQRNNGDKRPIPSMLGFEWSSSNLFPGGYKWSSHGFDDVGHINFYYKDVYSDAGKYRPLKRKTYDEIFTAMNVEWNNGHRNIGFIHHPLGQLYPFCNVPLIKHIPFLKRKSLIYNTNWGFLARELKNTAARDQIIRGVEVYSTWGTAIGKYSGLPIPWPYCEDNFDLIKETDCITVINDKMESWVENALWEWSENQLKSCRFVMQAGSDSHTVNCPGSAQLDKNKPAGIMAVYAIHNTSEELWDAMNNCDVYGTQLLKIRVNVRFDGQMALGQWIRCKKPLTITVSAQSTFPGIDRGGKNMKPDGYSKDELDYPISDIWVVKKDRGKGRPWCKIIRHVKPNKNMVIVSFEDDDVKPDDFYFVAVRQKGELLRESDGQDEYMAYIGPVFIDKVN
ncbi:MAG: hypothetical protein DRN27_09105 [Thermoplasmata archaeon]|nr:MAG: hypothetical protein DRN27_09105 [Thermoplasmata archaeon]